MFNLKILGSVSPYCKNDKNCPGYIIYNNKNKILLDCGFGVSRLLNFPEDLNNLTIIISHYHKDHYADLFAIKYAAISYKNQNLLKTNINVYIPYVEENDKNYLDYNLIYNENNDYFHIHEYKVNDKIIIDNLEVTFFETFHAIKNYSAKIKYNENYIVYSGDMGYKNIDKYIKFAKNANIFLCECSFLESEGVNNNYHLHTNEVLLLSQQLNIKKTIITHMWPEHDKKEYLKELNNVNNTFYVANENDIFYNIFET